MEDLSPEQRAVLDADIARLRERLEWRKAIMALPSKNERDADVDRLRRAVANLERASAPFLDGPPGFLSHETQHWLSEAKAVAGELRTLATPPKAKILARGMARPNQYRGWLVGEEIPALYASVYDGARLPLTIEGKNARGKRGMEFVRHVLAALGEADATDATIKVWVSAARRRVRANATRAKL
jgi:hypothetical protein